MKYKKLGFTLAEILITMGILGVIAALVIPSLLSKVFNQAYANQAKNMVASIQNMIGDELAVHKTRILANTDFATVNDILSNRHFDFSEDNNDGYNITYRNLDGENFTNPFTGRTLKLKNGIIITYTITEEDGNNIYHFIFDVNGDGKPNTFGRDLFEVEFNNRGDLLAYELPAEPEPDPDAPEPDPDEPEQEPATYMSECKGATEVSGACLTLIMNNNWKVPAEL